MARYEVSLTATAGCTVEVEADSEQEAREKAQEAAFDAFQESEFYDYEVTDIEEIEGEDDIACQRDPEGRIISSPEYLRHWIGVLANMPNRSIYQERTLNEFRIQLSQMQAAGQDN